MLPQFKITCVLLTLTAYAVGQTPGSKIVFSSITQVGLLNGQKPNAFAAQTINGIKKDKWFAGAGVGIDGYDSRTIPVFLDLRRDLSNKMNTPFAYIDGGINFLTLSSTDKVQTYDRKTTPGYYYDLGVGWKLKLKNNRAILLTAGYSTKQVREQYKVYWGAPTPRLQDETYDRYNYLYRRLIIKIGLQL